MRFVNGQFQFQRTNGPRSPRSPQIHLIPLLVLPRSAQFASPQFLPRPALLPSDARLSSLTARSPDFSTFSSKCLRVHRLVSPLNLDDGLYLPASVRLSSRLTQPGIVHHVAVPSGWIWPNTLHPRLCLTSPCPASRCVAATQQSLFLSIDRECPERRSHDQTTTELVLKFELMPAFASSSHLAD